ncbi:MAG: Ada metal-binding domain-containing protein [Nitrospiraceae bacterium]
MLSRDRRGDGRFVYAVSSTHVYCRPSCPSRRPTRNHVMFFDSPQLAESAVGNKRGRESLLRIIITVDASESSCSTGARCLNILARHTEFSQAGGVDSCTGLAKLSQ